MFHLNPLCTGSPLSPFSRARAPSFFLRSSARRESVGVRRFQVRSRRGKIFSCQDICKDVKICQEYGTGCHTGVTEKAFPAGAGFFEKPLILDKVSYLCKSRETAKTLSIMPPTSANRMADDAAALHHLIICHYCIIITPSNKHPMIYLHPLALLILSRSTCPAANAAQTSFFDARRSSDGSR